MVAGLFRFRESIKVESIVRDLWKKDDSGEVRVVSWSMKLHAFFGQTVLTF